MLSPLQRIPDLPREAERQLLQTLNELISDINRLSKARRVTPLQTGSFVASEGQTIRIRGGNTITLPRARAENQGRSVVVILETPGALRVVADKSQINGASEFTTNAIGRYEFESNGAAGWFCSTPGSAVTQGGGTTIAIPGNIALSAGTTFALGSAFTFSNSNNVSFGVDSVGVVTASATVASTQGSIRISAGTTSVLSSAFTFSNSNDISFGIATNGVVTADASRYIPVVSFSAGAVASSVTRLVFQNLNNITWNFITAANAVSVRALAAIGFTAGTTSAQLSQLSFADSHNVSFGLNGSTITASAPIRFSDGANTVLASAITFQSATGTETQNVTFGLAGSRFTAGANIGLSAGTTRFSNQLFSFADANNVSFGISTNAGGVPRITASATVAATRELGVVSHVGGNAVSSVSLLAFSNASNVTWSLSTAANAATVFASVNPGGAGGGIAIADIYGNTRSSGTVLFDVNNPNSTISQLFSANSRSGNVAFGITNASVMTAQAHLAFFDATGGDGSVATRVNFITSAGGGNVTFDIFTGTDTAGARVINVTANAPAIAFADTATTQTSGTINAHPGIGLSTLFSAGIGGNSTRNVEFHLAGGSNLAAFAYLRFDDTTTGPGNAATRVNFLASNGVTFGTQTTQSVAGGRHLNITASVQPNPTIAIAGPAVTATEVTNFRLQASGAQFLATSAANALTAEVVVDDRAFAGMWHRMNQQWPAEGPATLAWSAVHAVPIFFALENNDIEGTQAVNQITARSNQGPGRWLIAVSGQQTASTGVFGSSHPMTIRVGIYRVNNSTRLTLVNSASIVNTATSTGGSAVSFYGGVRWAEIPGSAWSNSSQSFREGLWAAVHFSTGATFESHMNVLGVTRPSGFVSGNAGLLGQAAASSVSNTRKWPFEGFYSTTTGALPGSVGSTNNNHFTGLTALNMFAPLIMRAGNSQIGHV